MAKLQINSSDLDLPSPDVSMFLKLLFEFTHIKQ